jgi:hypothetical protein
MAAFPALTLQLSSTNSAADQDICLFSMYITLTHTRPDKFENHTFLSHEFLMFARKYTAHSFSSVAYVWIRRAKTTGPIAKSVFSAVRNFQFRHMFCRNKKFCSVKSRFPVHLPSYKLWTILALYTLRNKGSSGVFRQHI